MDRPQRAGRRSQGSFRRADVSPRPGPRGRALGQRTTGTAQGARSAGGTVHRRWVRARQGTAADVQPPGGVANRVSLRRKPLDQNGSGSGTHAVPAASTQPGARNGTFVTPAEV